MRLFLGYFAAILFGVLALAGMYDYAVNQQTPLTHFQPSNPETHGATEPLPIGRTALSAAMMLVGIFAGALRSSLQAASQVDSVRAELKKTLRSTQFLKSIVAAPIVFSAIYLATKEQPDWVLSSIFAFENGFFCDAILRTREAKADGV